MKVSAFCHITSNQLNVNGRILPIAATDDWKKDLYRTLDQDYPKFHKMDALAKLAFLATEFMKKEADLAKFGEDELALIFANRFASFDTDEKFIESYTEKGSPSPSLFVYTLPNILTGELAIRNKWFGENIFFILEKFNAAFFLEQINFYFSRGSKACLCGWIEAHEDKEECKLFLVEQSEDTLTDIEINNLFKK